MSGVNVGNEGLPSSQKTAGGPGTATGNMRQATITTPPPAGAMTGMGGQGLSASPKIMSSFKDMAGQSLEGPNVQKLRS